MPNLIGNAQHWRKRAAEARATAAFMVDRTARAAMLDIAEKFESIACRSETRAAQGFFALADNDDEDLFFPK